jgi:hypothetical protein
MAVIVHLNNVFESDDPNVMQKLMDAAFRNDGKNFWQNFFSCENCHPGDKVVYLFTEYQLKILREYWDDKWRVESNEVREKMRFSCYRLVLNKEFKEVQSAEEAPGKAKKRVCYLKYSDNIHDLQLKELTFKWAPQYHRKEYKLPTQDKQIFGRDFFEGKFEGKPIDAKSNQEKRKEFVDALLQTREQIAELFGGPDKLQNGWLRYLGNEVYDSKFIQYCRTNPACPSVSAVFG